MRDEITTTHKYTKYNTGEKPLNLLQKKLKSVLFDTEMMILLFIKFINELSKTNEDEY